MGLNKVDNTIFVLQEAIKQFKIKVTNTTVKEFLLAHPHYPSLKCVCDALKKWKVKYYPLNLELDEIRLLEIPFIAHSNLFGGQLLFVRKIKNGWVTYSISRNKNITEEFKRFAEKVSGAVVILERDVNSGEQNYKTVRQNEILNISLLPLSITCLVGFLVFSFSVVGEESALFQNNLFFWVLASTKLCGLGASLFLVMHELNIHNRLTDKICNFSSKTNCNRVLSSSASNFFSWINWADIGFVYFTGTLTYLITSTEIFSLGLMAVVSALSIPYPLYSTYYQFVKLKNWCPFCMIVQIVLIIEFVVLFPVLINFAYNTIDLIKFIVSLIIPASTWFIFKAFLNRSRENDKEHYMFQQIKRQPEVFQVLLEKRGYTEIHLNQMSLLLGDPNAQVTLTAFLSLSCNPCAKAFKQLKVLLDICPEININTIFSIKNDNEARTLNTLYYLYKNMGFNHTVDFLYEWYSFPKQNRKTLYEGIVPKNFDFSEQIAKKNNALFKKHSISGTPTIYVNGYKFPSLYEYDIIEYYIDEIKTLNKEGLTVY